MGCTQSNAAVATSTKATPNGIKKIQTSYHDGTISKVERPNSNKSMNTTITSTTKSTRNTTTTTNSPHITTALSYEIFDSVHDNNNDNYNYNDEDDDFEVTTECDDESIHSMMLNSGRSKSSNGMFHFDECSNTMILSPTRQQQCPIIMIDEMSTDENYDDTIPNMDQEQEKDNVKDDKPPCTILTIRKNNTSTTNDVDTSTSSMTSYMADQSSNNNNNCANHYQRLLSIHQEQQHKLLSVITMVLPWTHAIVVRKQRHIALRQMFITSLLWFSMLLWPNVMHTFTTTSSSSRTAYNTSGTRRTSTIRNTNPTSLFHR
jgi:hypothetical protein